MWRAIAFLILFHPTPIRGSCFVKSPWANIRPAVQMINPCSNIDACEASCLGNSAASASCMAYAFASAKCLLLGADSGIAQTCLKQIPTCFVRTAACDATTRTAVTPTATATSTTTTSSNTSTSLFTTTARAATSTAKLPGTSAAATMTTSTTPFPALTTTATTTTITSTTASTTTSTTAKPTTTGRCGPPPEYAAPADCTACVAPSRKDSEKYECADPKVLYINGQASGTPAVVCNPVKLLWYSDLKAVADGAKYYCK